MAVEFLDVALSELTTLKVGGTAQRVVRVTTEAELVELVAECRNIGSPLLILGGGSNVVCSDSEFDGTVIVMTTAAALVTDHLLQTLQLHRIEIAVRPENIPSNRLAIRLGYTFEGVRPAFLHINRQWRDHNIYVMMPDTISGTVINHIFN
jgi:hypothetical protein